MKTFKLLNLALLGAFSMSLVSSCEDPNYDLDKLNEEIALGGENFTIKLGSSTKMTIADLLDLANQDGVIEKDNKLYYVDDTKLSTQTFSVPSVSIPAITVYPPGVNKSQTLPTPQSTFSINGLNTQGAVDMQIELPEQVKTISSGTLPNGSTISFTASVVSDIPGFTVTAKSLEVELPSFFEYQDNAAKKMVLTNVDFSASSSGAQELTKSENITKIVNSTAPVGGKISLSENVNISGDLDISSTTPFSGPINITISFKLLVDETPITSLTGTYDISIAKVENKFSFDLPEFLDNKNNVLDLFNSSINLAVKTDTPLPIETDVTLTPTVDGTPLSSKNLTQSLDVTASADGELETQNFTVTESDNGNGMTVSNLVNLMPETLTIDLESAVSSSDESTIVLEKNYQLDATMTMNVPFDMGELMNVNYTVSDMEFDLTSLGLQSPEIDLSIAVKNTIPLELQMIPVAMDENGNAISDIQVTVDKAIAAAPTDPNNTTTYTSETSTQLVLTIKEMGSTKLDKIKKLELDVVFKADFDSSKEQFVSLRSAQYMQFDEMFLKIPGGIIINVDTESDDN